MLNKLLSGCVCLSLMLVCSLADAITTVKLKNSAPDYYKVVKGDTLWSIAEHFLQQPWLWPQIWNMNQVEIHNPHFIYPGQIVMLDRSGPYLSIAKKVASSQQGMVKLAPQAYQKDVHEAVPSIPMDIIGPFLSYPLVLDSQRDKNAAIVVSVGHDHILTGLGDTIYATNIHSDNTVWQIYREGMPIVDPNDTQRDLGYKATYLGSAKLIRRATQDQEASQLEIISAQEDIRLGDQLIEGGFPRIFSYIPHAPSQDIHGRIIAIKEGMSEAGKSDVVTLNVGSQQGVDVGTVLSIIRHQSEIEFCNEQRKIEPNIPFDNSVWINDKEKKETQPLRCQEGKGIQEKYTLPEQAVGLLFVFRVFEHVSFALVMDTISYVSDGDIVRTP